MAWYVPTEPAEDGGEFDPSGEGNFNRVNKAGRYHVQVTAVDDEEDPKGQLVVDYEILGGKPTGQEGRTFRDWFAPSVAARNRIITWALACGITSEEDGKKAAVEKRPLTLHPKHAIDQQLIIDIEQGKKPDGTPRLECNWGIYPLDGPEAEGVVNKGMLVAASDAGDNAFADNKEAAEGQGTEGPAGTEDEFSDLGL